MCAPSVIIEEVVNARQPGTQNPARNTGRRIQTTLLQNNGSTSNNTHNESTSEKYIKQINEAKSTKQMEETSSDIIIETTRNIPTNKRNDIKVVKEVQNKSDGDKIPTEAVSMVKEVAASSESDNEFELDIKCALTQFLKTCKNVLPKTEYQAVEKKLNKYLNHIPEVLHKSVRLKNYIEMKWGLLDSDHKNVYIQIRDVLDEMKKYKRDGKSGTASELSDSNTTRKKVKVTTIYQPLRKATPMIQDRIDKQDDTKDVDDDDGIEIVTESIAGKSSSSHVNIDGSSTIDKQNDNIVQTSVAEKIGTNDDSTRADLSPVITLSNSPDLTLSPISSETLAKASKHVEPEPLAGSSKEVSSPGVEAPAVDSRKTASKRHIRKLEKALFQCEKQIRKLEDTEVDFDKDDESVYILEAK